MKLVLTAIMATLLLCACGPRVPEAGADSGSAKESHHPLAYSTGVRVIEFEGVRYTVYVGHHSCCLLRTQRKLSNGEWSP